MKSAALKAYESAATAYVEAALAGLRKAMESPDRNRFTLAKSEIAKGPSDWHCRIGKIQLKRGATLVCDPPCGNVY